MENKNNIIKLNNGLNVMLNNNDLTAEIIKSKEASGDVIIPRFVKYNSKSYAIKRIGIYAFEYNHFINSISFEEGSEVQSIGKNAFYHCSIKSLTIPENFKNFDNEWIQNTLNLTDINYSPKNKHFNKIDNLFLLFKKDLRSVNYDSIIFAPRNITGKVKIPVYIKEICPFSFNLCHKMKSLSIPPESAIQEIALYAFYKCYSLKCISPLPAGCTKIGRWCFAYSYCLSSMEFLSKEITLCVGCFSRCSSLMCASFPNGIKISICEHVFDRVSGKFILFTKTNAEIVKINQNL